VIDAKAPLFPEKSSKKSISSLQSLAEALSIPLTDLEKARKFLPTERYRSKEIPKAGGGVRQVYNPSYLIRLIQARINKRIFLALIRWPRYLFGSLPNKINGEVVHRDYIACAETHCLSKSLLKVDISNFFDNIHEDHVYHIFKELLKFSEPVSEYLTDICCYEGFLVQGALTSSYLATLCFWHCEGDVVKILSRKGLRYTRLVDDITVSSRRHDFNFDYAEHHIKMMLIDLDLPENDGKKQILRDGIEPLNVHGLRVNYQTPRLPADEVRKIRAAVHNVVKMAKINNYRTSVSYRSLHDRCMGRANKLARVGHNKHKVFKKQLLDILPLPSRLDVKKTERAISFLESLDADRIKERRYTRRFHLVRYRVLIVARTYEREARAFEARLYNLRPYIGSSDW